MKITVAGTGYVGLSISVLLAQNNEVTAIDIIGEKVDMINNRISPIKDQEIEEFLKNKELNLKATTDNKEAYSNAEFVIVAAPTNYDDITNCFDTSAVEDVIKQVLEFNDNAAIVIKSTIPVGYINSVRDKFQTDRIFFSPEFLREGRALYDNLYPSRIVVGEQSDRAIKFANLLKDGAIKKDIEILYTNPTEAEAIKLFANTYLALRVAYFNELDTYCEIKNLNTKQIIEGIGLDPRIGNHYNNPSFGYGGYCLPKDTKQLKANYENIPNDIITSIVASNKTRKEHIARMILKKLPKVVGIYRLTMKADSDNFRASAIQNIMEILMKNEVEVVVYEPTLKDNWFQTYKVISDVKAFKKYCDIIVANRVESDLTDVRQKVYTRDIYERD